MASISESFNRVILGLRHKAIITMLEEIRLYIMQRLVAINKTAFSLEDRITPSIRKRLELLKEKQSRGDGISDSGSGMGGSGGIGDGSSSGIGGSGSGGRDGRTSSRGGGRGIRGGGIAGRGGGRGSRGGGSRRGGRMAGSSSMGVLTTEEELDLQIAHVGKTSSIKRSTKPLKGKDHVQRSVKVKDLGARGVVKASSLGVVWMMLCGGIERERVVSRVVMKKTLEQTFSLFEFRGFSSFDWWKLIELVGGDSEEPESDGVGVGR
ncbi:hypothetical protein Tco_0906390 [Tanacetum coccineum]|uniref:Uncharacterized protein n=1 Tax=Tanacetum coccineum TaxID=301880 RepID=A0ABQ5CGC5_9ASTR